MWGTQVSVHEDPGAEELEGSENKWVRLRAQDRDSLTDLNMKFSPPFWKERESLKGKRSSSKLQEDLGGGGSYKHWGQVEFLQH